MALRLGLICAAVALALLIVSSLPWSGVVANGGTDAPRVYSAEDVAYGKALFSAKGCATCHINRRIMNGTGDCCGGIGPDLTTYTNEPAFLRSWLADPASVRPTTMMPDLDLSSDEIEDLIAFLNEPR